MLSNIPILRARQGLHARRNLGTSAAFHLFIMNKTKLTTLTTPSLSLLSAFAAACDVGGVDATGSLRGLHDGSGPVALTTHHIAQINGEGSYEMHPQIDGAFAQAADLAAAAGITAGQSLELSFEDFRVLGAEAIWHSGGDTRGYYSVKYNVLSSKCWYLPGNEEIFCNISGDAETYYGPDGEGITLTGASVYGNDNEWMLPRVYGKKENGESVVLSGATYGASSINFYAFSCDPALLADTDASLEALLANNPHATTADPTYNELHAVYLSCGEEMPQP